jgi:hypothetical protein
MVWYSVLNRNFIQDLNLSRPTTMLQLLGRWAMLRPKWKTTFRRSPSEMLVCNYVFNKRPTFRKLVLFPSSYEHGSSWQGRSYTVGHNKGFLSYRVHLNKDTEPFNKTQRFQSTRTVDESKIVNKIKHVVFEVFTAAVMNVSILLDTAPCGPCRSSHLLARWFLVPLIFGPKDGGDTLFRNVCSYKNYTSVYLRGWQLWI